MPIRCKRRTDNEENRRCDRCKRRPHAIHESEHDGRTRFYCDPCANAIHNEEDKRDENDERRR